MPKQLLAILVLMPGIAFAECGFTRSGNSMTIVVGKNAKCLSSESFRDALKSDIAEALDEGEVAAPHKRPFDDRNARAAKLWSIAERQHQASGRYWGQKR